MATAVVNAPSASGRQDLQVAGTTQAASHHVQQLSLEMRGRTPPNVVALSPPVPGPLAAKPSKTAITEPDPIPTDTIDALLRHRAQDHRADEAIVAYPSRGTDYVYYTPKQVRNTSVSPLLPPQWIQY